MGRFHFMTEPTSGLMLASSVYSASLESIIRLIPLTFAAQPRALQRRTSFIVFLIVSGILLAAAPVFSQGKSFTVRAIDFYGQDDLNVNVIRAALPLREGDQLSRESKDTMVGRLREAIKLQIGREPSNIAPVCCDDRGRLIIYIGLRGESVRQTLYNPSPGGSVRLPQAALEVYADVEHAWLNAMNRGVSGEDDSRGYALSLDAETRTKQLALHAYVARHSSMVRRVLASARDVEHRQIAAEMLGYAGRSREQIVSLIRASHDVDDGVRNNAMRALVVLARSSSAASAIIPGECFVGLLNSEVWTDRNKSAKLLSVLTTKRNPQLLTCLREQALTSLVEMARWSYVGHAYSTRLMLGRLAGIDEKTLVAMLVREEVEPIISAVTTQKSSGHNGKRCPLCTH